MSERCLLALERQAKRVRRVLDQRSLGIGDPKLLPGDHEHGRRTRCQEGHGQNARCIARAKISGGAVVRCGRECPLGELLDRR